MEKFCESFSFFENEEDEDRKVLCTVANLCSAVGKRR